MEGRIGRLSRMAIMVFFLVCSSMLSYRLVDPSGGSRKEIDLAKVHKGTSAVSTLVFSVRIDEW